MNQRDLLKALTDVVLGIAKLMGEETEVVLHDLERREMVYIVNGHITGRKPGYRLNSSIYDTILDLADQDGHIIGYGTHSAKGKTLRSSHFVIHDCAGKARALICINQDTARLEEARNLLDAMLRLRPLDHGAEAQQTEDAEDVNYIQHVTRQVIVDSIEKMKPTSLDSKEAKLEVLKKLEIKGVFAVKDAVPVVCKLLAISQATLYNYLRELRSQETASPKNDICL